MSNNSIDQNNDENNNENQENEHDQQYEWGSSTEDEEREAAAYFEYENAYYPEDDYYILDGHDQENEYWNSSSEDEDIEDDNEVYRIDENEETFDDADDEEEEDPTAIQDPGFRALPQEVQRKFYNEFFQNNLMLQPSKTLVIDRDNNSHFWTISRKLIPRTLEDYVLNDFIPHNDYRNQRLLLRTDFISRESNYVSTAVGNYSQLYVLPAQTETEVLESEDDPRPELGAYKVLYL